MHSGRDGGRSMAATALGLSAAALGALALAGWLLKMPRLADMGEGRVPMAPVTACLFILYGIGIALCARRPLGKWSRRAAVATACVCGLVAALLLVSACRNQPSRVEHLGLNISGTVQGAPVGHMSPVTAICFLLISISFLAGLVSPAIRAWRSILVFWAAGMVLALCLVFLLGYLAHDPLLYEGGIIPPALNNALAFALMALALLIVLAMEMSAPASGRMFLLIFTLLAAGIGAAGYLNSRNYARHYRSEMAQTLTAIGDMKVDELADWRRDRLAVASLFYRNANFGSLARRFLTDPADADARQRLEVWLGKLEALHQYDRVTLLDAAGVERMSAPAAQPPLATEVAREVQETLQHGQIQFVDFYRPGPGLAVRLGLLIPVLDDASSSPLGVLYLRVDPEADLYPFIQEWPTLSRTAETLLVRRDGDDVIYLNELRFRKGTALELRLPLTHDNAPVVKAVRGHRGVAEGVDYRGHEVLAYTRAVPESPWFLVVRMDTAEIYAPLRTRLRTMTGLVAALLFGAGTGLGLVWRNQRERHYRERFQAMQALRLSEERNRITLMSVGDGVLVTDAQGRVEAMNPVAESLTGWRQSEAQGRPVEEVFRIINEVTREAVESPVARVLSEGIVVGLANHTVLLSKDGTERPIADSGAPIRAEDRETTGVVLVFRDQTEERAVQTALRASEERYRNALDGMMEGCQILSPDLRYLYVNDAAVAHSRKSREELLGHTMTEVYPGIEDSLLFAELGRCMTTRAARRMENEFHYSDGSTGWFELSIEPVPQGVFILSIDITERKRTEEERAALADQLRHAQKLESVGRLAGGVAHDFNNILTGIIGYTDMALRQIGADSPFREDLCEVTRLAKRAADLTRQLLAFSRRQPLEPQVLNLNSVINDAGKMLRRVLGEDIDLHFVPTAGLGSVMADPGGMEQILLNLAINARDAMPQGGKLTMEASNVNLGTDYANQHIAVRPGPYVMLAVSDTGHGMDAATRERIFEPFFTTKEKGKGTGLGLATVYGIVKQHHGNIWVYSEPGKGATFKIYLPRVEIAADEVRPTPVTKTARGGETILVVEDEASVRTLTERILTGQGYTVLTAADAEEAERVFTGSALHIDLLVTDVVLPGINGRKLHERLHALDSALKVLYVSGYTEDAIVHHGVLDVGIHFLQKPFTVDALAAKVRHVLDCP